MPPMGFETAIPATARPKTYALDHAATEIGEKLMSCVLINPLKTKRICFI
jgi:hypothetical protein